MTMHETDLPSKLIFQILKYQKKQSQPTGQEDHNIKEWHPYIRDNLPYNSKCIIYIIGSKENPRKCYRHKT